MIKPDACPILDFIIGLYKTFTIPVYQRNYSWSTEHCEKLFDDLLESHHTGKVHYFGNVVYYATSTDYATGYAELALIDGQQRITTIMLLLAAIRDVFHDESITETYLINNRGTEKNRVKLKQIESDRNVYESIVNGNFEEKSDSNAGRNYKTFKKLIADSGISEADLLAAIRNLEIVALDLKLKENGDRAESPQVIFESINATGKKLSTADLIRNYLLMGIPDNEQERYYSDFWLKIELAVNNDRISDFINKYLVMKLGNGVYKDTEYKTFKKYLRKENLSEADTLRDLLKFSKYYSWIQKPELAKDFDSNASEMNNRVTTPERLRDLKELNTSSLAPLILFLLEKADNPSVSFNKDQLNNALFALESWAFRTRVAGFLTSGAFNTISSTSVLNILRRSTETNYDEQVIHILSNYRTQDIWPDDKDFTEAFKRYNFYKTYKNYVQRKLEYAVSTTNHKRHDWKPDSIEHIMPETLSPTWRKRLGENYADIHGEYLHTIGNLAPLNMHDQLINSNDTFENKQQQYKDADWFLTRQIKADGGDCEDWGVEQIQHRADVLAKIACKIWRAPEKRTEAIEADVKKKEGGHGDISPDGRAHNTIFVYHCDSYETKNGFIVPPINAKMRIEIINDKPRFIVMAGSTIFPYEEADRKLPNQEAAIRKAGWNGEITLDKDVDVFTSPSGASNFVSGGASNGWAVWKTEDGETLDEVVAADAEASYEQTAND